MGSGCARVRLLAVAALLACSRLPLGLLSLPTHMPLLLPAEYGWGGMPFSGWGGWGGRGGGRGRGRGGPSAQRPKGVGYGGSEGRGRGGDRQQDSKRKAEAVKRQDSADAAAGDLLHQLRQRLEAWAGGALSLSALQLFTVLVLPCCCWSALGMALPC